MAVLKCCAIGLVMLGAAGRPVWGAEPVTIKESTPAGSTTQVLITLKAEGLYQPAPAPSAGKAEAPKALNLRVETRLAFAERVLKVGPRGRVTHSVRSVVQAASAINGEIRPMAAVLRPEVRLLLAEPRGGSIVVFSPDGPLTRPELELVQGPGDPLALRSLLPDHPVAVGDHWTVGDDAARSLSAYDALASNALEATLESVDEKTAKVRLRGVLRGAALGAEGTITASGSFTVDRKAGWIDSLKLDRTETRKPGAVEAGLDIKSTLIVERRPAEIPGELTDKALASISLNSNPRREQLLLVSVDRKYSLVHDRDWHLYWDDRRLTVLKRLDRGEVVAQCNLTAGPNAGKGRHQDLGQFRDDIRRALGTRFSQFVGEGEVDGDPAGGFRYKVGVQGRQGETGVLWDYFLVARPDGDQLLVTFTLAQEQAKSFGDQDTQLIRSLRWLSEPATASKNLTAERSRPRARINVTFARPLRGLASQDEGSPVTPPRLRSHCRVNAWPASHQDQPTINHRR